MSTWKKVILGGIALWAVIVIPAAVAGGVHGLIHVLQSLSHSAQVIASSFGH